MWGAITRIFISHYYKIDGEVVGLNVEVTNYREKMVRGDSHLLPFKEESFDSVFAGEVIEHLTNPALFMKEVERVLKRGVSVFTIPNMYSLTILYIMLYIKKCEINYEPSEGLGHVYCWDISLFRSVIKRAVSCKLGCCGVWLHGKGRRG